MKKVLVLLMALTLVFMMTACGSNTNEYAQSMSNNSLSVLVEDEEQNNETTETSSVKESSKETADDVSWREFLKEYEKWVDKYIIVVKKYNANPSDLSILTEYTSLVAEIADWTEKADNFSDSIVDVEDAAEYSAEIIRIAAKMAKAAEEL